MSLLRVLLLLMCVLLAIELAPGVAPGDEEQSVCQDLRADGVAPIPDYDPSMAILMDSWNYQNLLPVRTGAVWVQEDNDTNNPGGITTNWIQNSNTPCQQSAQACGFSAGQQSNWLLTQLINRTVSGVRLSQVTILIEYELRNCDTTLRCQRTFNTHVYETSSENANGRSNLRNYRQVRRISPDNTSGQKVNETVTVTFNTNNSSFYFAIEDETTCIVVNRVIVFYSVCPSQMLDRISYPETIAPVAGTGALTITAACVDNAEPVNDIAPKLICSAGGIWSALSVAECRCVRGALDIGGRECKICLAGTYLSPSNNSCSFCPANSVSERDGLAQCDCSEGYYRAETGEEDLPCTLPPSRPRNVRVTGTTDNTISVTWDPPAENPGGRNLTYNVYTSLDDGATRVLVANVGVTSTTIINLQPGRMYTVIVSTASAITDQIPDEQFGTISTAQVASTTGSSGAGANVVTIAVPVAVVLIFIIGASIVGLLFLVWICRKTSDGSKDSMVYQDEVEVHQISTKQENEESLKGFSVQSSFKHDLPMHLIIPSSRIKLTTIIGQGEFGVVHKGYVQVKADSVIVAIKTLKGFYDKATVRDMLKECSKMYRFNHPNVLTLTGVCLDGGPAPYILMPLMTNGSLLAYLKKNRDSLVVSCESNDDDDDDVRFARKRLMDMCLQIAKGMEYLANMKMVHRDLAARNCMIDTNYVIKVADFGLAESVGTKEYFRQDKSTIIKLPLKWMAPESLQDYIFSEKSDVWAFGVTCWEIFTGGTVPYPSINLVDLSRMLIEGHRLEKPVNDACSDQIFTFMSQCWELDANKRPTFTCLVSSLSQSLEDMADYMDVTAFGVTMPNTNVDVSGESNEQRYHKI